MEPIRAIWALYLLFSLLAVPQLLGILAYFRVVRIDKLLAHLLYVLVPPATCFFLTWRIWFNHQYAGHAHECGMSGLIGVFFVLLGTFAQIGFTLLTQIVLLGIHGGALRRSKAPDRTHPTGTDQVD